MRYLLLVLAALGSAALPAVARVKSDVIRYKQGDTTCIGYLAYDDSLSAKRPAVLIAPEWWGLVEYPKRRADQLAQLGYVAFVADIYGNGVTASTPEDARAHAMSFYSDRARLRARMSAALATLKEQPLVDGKRIAVIGYCFGGAAALELARSGADLAGVVTFHGSLATPTPADARAITGKVLVCTGADDPNVKPEEVAAFENEMRAAHVNYQINVYGGAVHAFTNPAAGNDNAKGMAYNAQADHRSWEAMRQFFDEIFR
jgi:dienelactone hydrolase